MITVTDQAVLAIRDSFAAESKAAENAYLRVSVKGGGCSGLMYNLSIVDGISDEDAVVEVEGVRIVVDKKSKIFLHGMTLDHSSGLNGKGFTFTNPNASGTCGCGQSFAV